MGNWPCMSPEWEGSGWIIHSTPGSAHLHQLLHTLMGLKSSPVPTPTVPFSLLGRQEDQQRLVPLRGRAGVQNEQPTIPNWQYFIQEHFSLHRGWSALFIHPLTWSYIQALKKKKKAAKLKAAIFKLCPWLFAALCFPPCDSVFFWKLGTRALWFPGTWNIKSPNSSLTASFRGQGVIDIFYRFINSHGTVVS